MLDKYLLRIEVCQNVDQINSLVSRAADILSAAEFQILINSAIKKLDSIVENLHV